MDIPPQVYELVERFDRHLDDYKCGKYNETQVRREFIDPLFRALGWDIDNTQGYAETYKEVVHEDAIKIGQATKAPDYSFRIGGVRKFFLEAKKPSVDIKHDTHPAYQLRRYAWSAKLPLSILTDFEEFAVYDCRIKPDKADQAAAARVMYLRYTDYLDQWPVLVDIFSPESIKKGSFDKYVESKAVKRGTAEVDTAFLQEIERWRDVLARNLALRNRLTPRQLNYAVQQTIDRIIFLRIAEDRGIEPYGQLRELAQADAVYPRLFNLFARADARYNSGLFHFDSEKGRPDPDTFTPTLTLDDKVLKDIFKNLYYPDSPYEFSVLPADILGQVYEQFLGKVIRLTVGGQAKVEDKPEVKKAGGVYYTPTYIVEYIVRQTVGKLVEGQTPADISGAPARATGRPPLRILDPACGSGSFLLGAYQFLLNWYLNWYLKNDPGKWAKKKNSPIYPALTLNPQTPNWKLTVDERKRILLTHIYGVDIDPQAVEVTKLSLLLKVLEDEQSVAQQLGLFQERVLPDLDHNIKCGNSLIGPDFYQSDQLALFDEEESYRINAFDWQKEFPQVFAGETLTPNPSPKGRGESLLPLPLGEGWGEDHTAAGFDAVIGNPPYIRIQTLEPSVISYLSKSYQTTVGNYDIYCPFLEKAVNLLTDGGYASFILPHRFFKTDYGDGLRTFLSRKRIISKIIDFDGYMVFKDASINTCVILLTKGPCKIFKFAQIRFIKRPETEIPAIMEQIDREVEMSNQDMVLGDLSVDRLSSAPWVFIFEWEKELWQKLSFVPLSLGDISSQIFQGLKTGADAIFSVRITNKFEQYSVIHSSADNQRYEIENDVLFPQIKGGEMKRYHIGETNRGVIFPYQNGKLIDAKSFQINFPRAWEYLKVHQKYLEDREDGKMKGSSWYGYTRSQALSSMQQPKILTPDYYAHASYCIDIKGEYFFFGGGAGGYGIVLKEYTPHYVIGLLNSRLLDWYLRKISVRQYQTAFSYVKKYIQQLPIRTINFSDPADHARHDRMVSLVEQMLKLNQQLAQAATPQDKTMLKRQVEVTDSQIDKLVYELYNLTAEEIKIVEGKV